MTSHFSLVSGSMRHTRHLISRSNRFPGAIDKLSSVKPHLKELFGFSRKRLFIFLNRSSLSRVKISVQGKRARVGGLHVASTFESVSGD